MAKPIDMEMIEKLKTKRLGENERYIGSQLDEKRDEIIKRI
jgi:hypothetical protein